MIEHPQGFADIQRRELSRVTGAAMRTRLAVSPVAAVIAALIVLIAPNPWRAAVLGLGVLALLVIAVIEWWRFRQSGLRADTLSTNVVLMSAFQILVIFSTGALESPLMPAVLPLGFMGTILLGATPALALLAGLQVVAVWAFALGAVWGGLPDVTLSFFGSGARAGHNDALLLTEAGVYTALVGVITGVGLRLRRAFDTMLHEALVAREEALVTYSTHARELTTLSGEIAHELKNPLTTVKALAALLDRDTTGRAAERLRILRAEVDRMQLILEEFLNFSRPLTPLVLRDFDMADLCLDVIALHEGITRGRGLTLGLSSPAPTRSVRADPRKIRQILINLLQNAVEASPDGARIALRVLHAPDGETCIEVADEGVGLPGQSTARLFEPGMTTRETGSGLGLTVARALARQHGGEVELLPRPDGATGCLARLRLPPVVPPEITADA